MRRLARNQHLDECGVRICANCHKPSGRKYCKNCQATLGFQASVRDHQDDKLGLGKRFRKKQVP